MKDGKPEQVGWCDSNGEILSLSGKKRWLGFNESLRDTADRFSEPLIRLSDHEAVVADLHKSIQRMIDQTTPLVPDPNDPKWSRRIQIDDLMAQVAELKSLLDDCREIVVDCENYAHDEGSYRRVQRYRDQIARIDAALSK